MKLLFFLSFVVYFNLRSVASSCNIPASNGYSEEGICVLCVQAGFREQGNVIDSVSDVKLAAEILTTWPGLQADNHMTPHWLAARDTPPKPYIFFFPKM